MNMNVSVEKLTRLIVNIDEALFKKYEAGIKAHFNEYLRNKFKVSIDDGQVDLSALGVGIQALRKDYMKKNSSDYSAEDSAGFILSGHELFTAEYLSVNTVTEMIENYYNDPESIENVYIKRSASTGRLIPCVNKHFVESILSEKQVTDSVESQLQEIEAILEDYETKQARNFGFEQYQVVNLIAEKTAEIIMRRMKISQAV